MTKFYKALLLLAFISVAASCNHGITRNPASRNDPESLATKNYTEIKRVSLELLKLCPPEDCVVVSLGRSPTPFATFLKILFPNSTIELPMSAFRYLDKEINEADQGKLFSYFETRLPEGKVSGKRVLLMDYAASGESLYSADKYLARYLSDFGVDLAPVALIGYSKASLNKHNEGHFINPARGDRVRLGEVIKIESQRLLRDIGAQRFDDLAAYESYRGYFIPLRPIENHYHTRETFVETLKRNIDRDDSLNQRIEETLNPNIIETVKRKCRTLIRVLSS